MSCARPSTEPGDERGRCRRRRSALDRQPKYLRIHAELRDRISTGRWPAGHPLPAQRDLAAEFGVSVMTLRQALQLLADDGLIHTRHGSGTYVAQRYAHDLGHLRSFASDLAGQGARISTRLLAAGPSPPRSRWMPGSAAPVRCCGCAGSAGRRPAADRADLLPACRAARAARRGPGP